jgi:hypothetical protein
MVLSRSSIPGCDMTWLPRGLTSLKLQGISVSCHGHTRLAERHAAAYAAALLQVRVQGGARVQAPPCAGLCVAGSGACSAAGPFPCTT